MTYASLNEKLGTRAIRKQANNTYIVRQPSGAIAMKFHKTNVVTFHQTGELELSSGGWRTLTTRERIQRALLNTPFSLGQDRGIWYLYRQDGNDWRNLGIFQDGCVLNPKTGEVSGLISLDKGAELSQLRRKIQTFSGRYVSKLMSGEIPAPSGGDCWYCSLRAEPLPETDPRIKGSKILHTPPPGQPTLGESSGNTDHLVEHMTAPAYYVPSLLVRALEVFPPSKAAVWVLHELWGNGNRSQTSPRALYGDIARCQFRKSLNRYLYRQFSMA